MAVSHRSAEPKSAPRRRKVAARRSASSPDPIYSSDQKRQLILAHAAMRQTHDPIQMMSAWAGVAVVLVLVAVGWWWSSGTTLVQKAGNIGADAKELMANAPAAPDFSSLMQNTSDRLRVMEAQASNQQQALDMMASLVASSTPATSSRSELFQPIATSTSSTTTELNP